MILCHPLLKCAVASVFATVVFLTPVSSQQDEIEALLTGLQTADAETALQIENRIYQIWSQSGSDSMDLLLERGREALSEGDTKKAIEHLTALVDHAPEFAEAYNSRATAYFEAGMFGPSLEDLQRTLALNPDHFAAINGLALIFEQMGEPELALRAWREVEKIYPTRAGLTEALARLEGRLEGRDI